MNIVAGTAEQTQYPRDVVHVEVACDYLRVGAHEGAELPEQSRQILDVLEDARTRDEIHIPEHWWKRIRVQIALIELEIGSVLRAYEVQPDVSRGRRELRQKTLSASQVGVRLGVGTDQLRRTIASMVNAAAHSEALRQRRHNGARYRRIVDVLRYALAR